MNKELEALNEIKEKYENDNGLLRRLDIIETALKEYEKLKYLKPYTKEDEKRKLALEIIKEELLHFRFHDRIQQVWISTIDDLSFIICQNIESKENYNLLKEVLL